MPLPDEYDRRLLLLEQRIEDLENYVEQLEGRLLTRIDGRPRPHWPDAEPEELQEAAEPLRRPYDVNDPDDRKAAVEAYREVVARSRR